MFLVEKDWEKNIALMIHFHMLIFRGGFKGGYGGRVHPRPIICNHLFRNQFEELQTILFTVERIINNPPLIYVNIR